MQSSSDDVNAELDHIRSHELHKESSKLFIGCYGLGYSRIIHRLSQDARDSFETPPVVIPQLGEPPTAWGLSRITCWKASLVAVD
eukprot:6176011-Pleurochrysis_carterae.AAC.1